MAKGNLDRAKAAKNDEFYTQLQDVADEVLAYFHHDPQVFKGKTVLLPCDDPEWSAFTSFFVQQFDRLGLHKLISTSYNPAGRGKVFTVKRDLRRKQTKIDDLEWSYLTGDGDFRSDEVTALRDEADFVISNPPFSLFREFLAWVVAGGQRFSLIGNMNAITYNSVFPLLVTGDMWSGATPWHGMTFRVPDSAAEFDYITEGVKYKKLGNVIWYTNIDHGRRHDDFGFRPMAKNRIRNTKVINNPKAYKRYDNFDAIEVPATTAVPCDYDGVMGVPISYLDKHNPDLFEIIGISNNGRAPEFVKLPHHKPHHEPFMNGKPMYSRLFIRRIAA